MNFTEKGGVVTGLPHYVTKGSLPGEDLRRHVKEPGTILISSPPWIVSSENAVTRGSANRGRSMGVAENHPVFGELFQVGQVDFAFGVVDLAVPNAHIIHQENQDIGWGGPQRLCPS